MAAPTNLSTVDFPSFVTVPAGGGASSSVVSGGEFDITRATVVEMAFELPAGSNVNFSNGTKRLQVTPENFTSIGPKRMTQTWALSVPGNQAPDSPIAITIAVKYADDPQTTRRPATVLVQRDGLAVITAIVAGAAAITAPPWRSVSRHVAPRKRSRPRSTGSRRRRRRNPRPAVRAVRESSRK